MFGLGCVTWWLICLGVGWVWGLTGCLVVFVRLSFFIYCIVGGLFGGGFGVGCVLCRLVVLFVFVVKVGFCFCWLLLWFFEGGWFGVTVYYYVCYCFCWCGLCSGWFLGVVVFWCFVLCLRLCLVFWLGGEVSGVFLIWVGIGFVVGFWLCLRL